MITERGHLVLESGRLRLRPMTTGDAPFMFTLMNSKTWLDFIGDRGIRTLEDAKAYIKDVPLKSYSALGHGLLILHLKTSGQPVGICGLVKRDELGGPDLGFAILPEFEGQGLAYEASLAVINDGRDRLGLKEIFAITTSENARSIALLKKLGMAFREKMKAHSGVWFDLYVLSDL